MIFLQANLELQKKWYKRSGTKEVVFITSIELKMGELPITTGEEEKIFQNQLLNGML